MRSLCISLCILLIPAGLLAALEPLPPAVERFERHLLASPDSGTAFDRVVEWFSTEAPGIEALAERWRAGASSESDAAAVYALLAGLLAAQNGEVEAARAALQQAIETLPQPLPAIRALAEFETAEGNLTAAAEAYRQALAQPAARG